MISYHEALELLLESAVPVTDTETPPFEEIVGRIAAADVFSHLPNPPFSNSSYDGFALRAGDTAQASISKPVELSVSGSVAAGEAPLSAPTGSRPSVVEIVTGAPMPLGYDTIIKIEDVEVTRNAQGRPTAIKVFNPLKAGENVRFTGEDFPAGEVLLRAGTQIQPEHIMAFTASGINSVKVLRKPRIALISTGKEIVSLSALEAVPELPPGKIFNSTAPFLVSGIRLMGADVTNYGIIPDQRDAFNEAFARILQDDPDIMITTGAVSVGLYDFIPDALNTLGAEVLFHRLAIRPGRPMLFARFKKPNGKRMAIFGFPGNQISSVVGQRFFLAPYLRAIYGSAQEPSWKATFTLDFHKPVGLRMFCLGRLSMSDEGPRFSPWPRQMSYMLGPLLHSNSWAILPEGVEVIKAGQMVECAWLYPSNYTYR